MQGHQRPATLGIVWAKKRKDDKQTDNGFEDWGGYMAAKKAKLQEQFCTEATKEFKNSSKLFEGIAIFVNGYTDPTADELRRLMMAHGGIYHHYLRPNCTTHIIASNLPYSKIQLYRKSKNPIPICKPEWIIESIHAERVLNFQQYLLYSNCTNVQPQLNFNLESHKQTEHSNDNTKSTTICTKDTEFLSEFYNNSRLHHISTLGAEFKSYINGLRDNSNNEFVGLKRLKKSKNIISSNEDHRTFNSIIMHIDMDCFFVSVGLRKRPELKGLPIAVTHAKSNNNAAENPEHGSMSEIASCSYEARKAGIKNGMFLGQALKKCPNLQTIPYDFDEYKEVAYTLYDTVASYTLDIEAVSCDEMYVDCTKILGELNLTPMGFATELRKEIENKTGCPVSTGFGNNKLQARLATKKAKPHGQFYLNDQTIQFYIQSLRVEELPGVGGTSAHKLHNLKINTCKELQKIPLNSLQKDFGKKTGELLFNMCRGIDDSKLNLEYVRKSVSADVNYGIRFANNDEAIEFLKKLSDEVFNRLKKANAKGRCITLKLMVRAKDAPKETKKFMGHGICDNLTKSKNLLVPIDDLSIIRKEILGLWNQLQQIPEDVRGIGIQISRLELSKKSHMNLLNFVETSVPFRNMREDECKEENQQNMPSSSKLNNFAKDRECQMNVCNNEKRETCLQLNESNANELDSKFPSTPDIMLPSQDIDESVFDALPEDIKTEIIKTKSKKQTRQEEFFKHKKPNLNKSSKIKMPPLKEIDLSVLIELPPSIRNEIINEYSKNKNNTTQEMDNNDSKKTIKQIDPNERFDDSNLSFSQVDPEFLAALTDDLKDEVKNYLDEKKIKKQQNANKKNAEIMDDKSKKWHEVHKKKDKMSKSKNNKIKGKRFKSSKSLHDEIDHEENTTTKLIKTLDTNQFNEETKCTIGLLNKEHCNMDHQMINEREKILMKLVDCLFSLPFKKVEMQIKTWVTRSKSVNEVDFLSLATFLSMLPEKKRIEDLHILLKTMHRCSIETGSCVWHKTYRKTVKYVQHHMQIEYNSNLMLPPIGCNLLQCNSDDII